MKIALACTIVLAAAVSAALWNSTPSSLAAAPAAAPAATVPFDYTIPEIPLDKIKFTGTGYPQIPGDVQTLIDRREDVWSRMSHDSFMRAMPEVERWGKLGRPWVKVARQAADLLTAPIPAFPGAEGGAMYTYGGRGGKVFVVTSLADHGPGTFREACEAGGVRTIVFGVAGIIHLERPLEILAPFVTIAGQTAPGDGICVAGQTTHIRTHDVIIRYMRFRRGIHDISSRDDSLSGDPIGNIIVDHCSTSWGNDETFSLYRQMYAADPNNPKQRQKMAVINNSIQWTIITETLDTFHHGFGATWGGVNTGFQHNLFACCTGRNSSISSTDFNFVNNVLFNWRHRTLDGGGRSMNIINNYFKPGPITEGELRYRIAKPEGGRYYVSGNYVDGNEKVTKDNWDGGIQKEGADAQIRATRVDTPFPMPTITMQSAEEAYKLVLDQAGATLPRRDPVDVRVINQVRTGEVLYKEGKGIITDISQVGGYPEYKGGPVKYTQNDGIPDWWKTKYHFELTDATLAAKDTDGDGYTTLEEYLNGTNPTEKIDYKDLKNNVNTLVAGAAGKLTPN